MLKKIFLVVSVVPAVAHACGADWFFKSGRPVTEQERREHGAYLRKHASDDVCVPNPFTPLTGSQSKRPVVPALSQSVRVAVAACSTAEKGSAGASSATVTARSPFGFKQQAS